MRDLNRKAILGLMRLALSLGVLVFLPAWTFNYWQAWVCLAVFFASATAITVFLMKKDAKLLERRMKGGAAAETEKSQKIVQSFSAIAFIALFVVSALDHRFGWSRVPAYVAIAGDGMIALGFILVFWVFAVNTFTSGVIEVAEEQVVITTGPYALVRHPMYFGALVMVLGIPLALASWWGLIAMIPMTLVIVVRLVEEEKFLTVKLRGYLEYRNRVKYRIAPYLW
jgi:protein-S-isoprenylcysteine O-methyltransferase Ste14